MTDTWAESLTAYHHRSRLRHGWVAVRTLDLRRILDEREQFASACNRLEDECDRLRSEIADREFRLARHQPVWEKESA